MDLFNTNNPVKVNEGGNLLEEGQNGGLSFEDMLGGVNLGSNTNQ